jgi:serine/threonine protein kinase
MLGTVAYMSPEQVKAKDLDARTDLFSFGAVLYEMATGRMPFNGSSSGEICGSVLRDEPVPAMRLNPEISPDLEVVIRKALEKPRNLRYQHASEMRTDLQRLKRDTESGRYARASLSASGTANPSATPVASAKAASAASSSSAKVAETPSSQAQPIPAKKKRWPLLLRLPSLSSPGLSQDCFTIARAKVRA